MVAGAAARLDGPVDWRAGRSSGTRYPAAVTPRGWGILPADGNGPGTGLGARGGSGGSAPKRDRSEIS